MVGEDTTQELAWLAERQAQCMEQGYAAGVTEEMGHSSGGS